MYEDKAMNLTAEQIAQYDRDGFLIFPKLLSTDEVSILQEEIERVSQIRSEMIFREGDDGAIKIMFRLHEKDGATGSPAFHAACRTGRILKTAQKCLHDDEIYIHHCKVNMKAAIEGSAWPWHQDFHTWHLDGISEPNMATMTIVLTEATQVIGCLYVLPGSHKLGRTDPRWDNSTAYNLWAAKPQDMKTFMRQFPEPIPITGGAGTAAIFDCNLLQASGHNLTAEDRWQVFFCFNQCRNHPEEVKDPRPDYVRSLNWSPIQLGSEDGILTAREN